MNSGKTMKGVFGKLPAHGDFILRELPGVFSDTWDTWLQRSVHGSRELVGEAWLEHFLTSPIWRFALSPGVIDGRTWGGVLLPSVDSVGRYFPLTLCTAVEQSTSACDLIARAETWYSALSELGICALQEALTVDQLMERFPDYAVDSSRRDHVTETCNGAILSCGNTNLAQGFGCLLEQSLPDGNSHSVWWAPPTAERDSMMNLSYGLPEPELFAAMIGAPMTKW
ncbi:type VI secretion system-associated protein TagF [Microbulbifer sp.]|uniref:type VI secretion system-associated protein TagF n=1 Tax=Microbulbifer sp. TaxID=1908541 RepID=UPI002588C2F3|nr:type VI secretion system-associated protein TagF [Microbulbifer sp.]